MGGNRRETIGAGGADMTRWIRDLELNRWTPVQVGWMCVIPAVVAMVIGRALWQLGGRLW